MNRLVVRTGSAVIVVCLVAAAAFVAGERHQRNVTVLRGVAYVGIHEATIMVAGWEYGIQGTSVPWVDGQGTLHEGSWPSCLPGPGKRVPVTFGEIPVTSPDGTSWRQVVWVDCRS